MSDVLTKRLNQILPKVISDEFLSGSGIGNEIAFYIFDYPPEQELRVREHIRFLLNQIPKRKPGLRLKHINLFDFILDYLKSRNLLDKSLQMQIAAALRVLGWESHSDRHSKRMPGEVCRYWAKGRVVTTL